MSTEKPFFAGIIDYNPKRMSDAEANQLGIPPELLDHLADHRQYPLNISKQFPDGISWFNSQQPWFFRRVMGDEEKVKRLQDSEVLIFSGSGMSAHRYSMGEGNLSSEERLGLEKSEELTRDFLGQGKWILGICFGGQLALHAVGAEIGRLPTMDNGESVTESGWLDHKLTPAALNDPVFRFLAEKGDTFYAPHLHNDFVAQLPKIESKIETESGIITVTESNILAFRSGFCGKEGVENADTKYIQASVVVFDNGARVYQIQPHPEMATKDKANFLVRKNPWVSDEMGEDYYQRSLFVPKDADFSVAGIITSFVRESKLHLESRQGRMFESSTIRNDLYDYLIE